MRNNSTYAQGLSSEEIGQDSNKHPVKLRVKYSDYICEEDVFAHLRA